MNFNKMGRLSDVNGSPVFHFQWQTDDNKLVDLELTITNDGIKCYCDGQGNAELNIAQNTVNTATLSPKLGD